jgi:hypothetical protein
VTEELEATIKTLVDRLEGASSAETKPKPLPVPTSELIAADCAASSHVCNNR